MDNILNIEENRLDYLEIMQPLAGYKIDKIIATTYSLDIDTITYLLLMLGTSIDEFNSKDSLKRMYVFETLKKIKDKVIIFCQSGRISKKNGYSDMDKWIYSIFEDIIYPVKLDNNKSFHPKTFLIRYSNGNDIKYKFIVLSRNLTFSKNLDVVVSLDGNLVEQKIEKNESLYDFHKYLFELSQKEYGDFATVLEEIRNISFELNNHREFTDVEFIPIGLEKYREISRKEILNKKYISSLVMSPFISSNIVEQIYNNCFETNESERILLTRNDKDLLALKNKKIDSLKIYAVNDELYNLNDDETTEFDIHAKLYFFELENGKTELYIGSANETNSALGAKESNIEFLIKLSSEKNSFNLENLKNDFSLEDDKKMFFKQLSFDNIEEIDEKTKNETDKLINEIIKINCKGQVTESVGKYTTKITFENYSGLVGHNITIAPLTKTINETSLLEEVIFKDMDLTDLTEFYVIRIDDKSFIMKIPVENIPIERNTKLAREQIKTTTDLLEYLLYMVGSMNEIIDINNIEIERNRKNQKHFKTKYLSGLYENLIKALYNDKDIIDELDELLKTFDNEEDEEMKEIIEFLRKIKHAFSHYKMEE